MVDLIDRVKWNGFWSSRSEVEQWPSEDERQEIKRHNDWPGTEFQTARQIGMKQGKKLLAVTAQCPWWDRHYLLPRTSTTLRYRVWTDKSRSIAPGGERGQDRTGRQTNKHASAEREKWLIYVIILFKFRYYIGHIDTHLYIALLNRQLRVIIRKPIIKVIYSIIQLFIYVGNYFSKFIPLSMYT